MARRKNKNLVGDIIGSSVSLGVGTSVVGSLNLPSNISSSVNAGFGLASAGIPLMSAKYTLKNLEKLKRMK